MALAESHRHRETETRANSVWRRRLRVFWGSWESRLSLGFLLLLLLVSLVPAGLWPESAHHVDLSLRHQLPTIAGGDTGFLLGTDALGRDMLFRILASTRLTLTISGLATLFAMITGTVAGLLAGYYRGWVDALISRAVDMMLAFPTLLIVLALVSALGQSVTSVVVVLGLSGWAGYTRVIRSAALTLSQQEFVEAARSLGSGNSRVLWRHLLPNVVSPLLVLSTFSLAQFILTESAISFLGLGPAPPNVTWGGLIGEGRNYMYEAWWSSLFPGAAIVLTALFFNLAGDGLRDAFDARTPVGRGKKGGEAGKA